MKTTLKAAAARYSAVCTSIYGKFSSVAVKHATTLCLLFGMVLLTGGLLQASHAAPTGSFSEAAYEDDLVRGAVANLFALIEGAFGALIMVVAGLGAIVAAAMGAYRAAVGMLVVAVGAFILRALVSLFFGAEYEAVGITAGGGA